MTNPSKLYADLMAAFQRSDWHSAWRLCVQLMPLAPRHAGVYGIGGVVSLELQRPDRAVGLLCKAVELDPSRVDFLVLYSKALSMNRQAGDALLAADRALALARSDPTEMDVLGVIYTKHQAHERAVTAFRRAVALAPRLVTSRFNLATALVAIGEIDDAEREFETCIALDFTSWQAHMSLSQLRRQTIHHNHLERLLELLSLHEADTNAATYLNMALAKEYEDLGEHAKAFQHIVRGKASGRSTRTRSMQRDEAMFESLMRASPASNSNTVGDPSNEPIFVIGMPRTGTTLLERILSSHPEIYNAGELQNFPAAFQQASHDPLPALFNPEIATLSNNIDWRELGASYLASTRQTTGRARRFVDKLPHNFLYAGFIAHALPNAKIICLRRNPLDTCISNYRQLFEQDSPHFDYSFDLLNTGRYYILFDRLMAHWQRIFPGHILEVSYESLVMAPAPIIQHLLDFCELTWHDDCMHFENNPAPVATYSAVQTRSKLYQHAILRWKKYEKQITELISLLTSSGINVDT